MSDSGRKNDNGKHRYDLVPVGALRAIVEVLTFGASKYDDDNWRRVPDARRRYTAALMRHVEAWRGGEATDPETGAHHLAHAACCAMFLIETEAVEEALAVAARRRCGLLASVASMSAVVYRRMRAIVAERKEA